MEKMEIIVEIAMRQIGVCEKLIRAIRVCIDFEHGWAQCQSLSAILHM